MSDLTQWAETWEVSEEAAPRLIAALRRSLANRFGTEERIPLWSPQGAGWFLLKRSGVDVTPLPEDIRRLIVNTSCQHRMEPLWQPQDVVGSDAAVSPDMVPGLAYYDGRAMYMETCKGLYSGPCRRVEGGSLDTRNVGRALVKFRIPDQWRHVGLLAVKNECGEGWLWPSSPSPPGGWETWADYSEIRFAASQGWAIEFHESLLFDGPSGIDPWATRLGTLYQWAQKQGDKELARCYRAICLRTIGSFHSLGTYTKETFVPEGAEASIGDHDDVQTTEGGYLVRTREAHQHRRWSPEQSHPEWSAATWARTHLRVNKALLALQREWILGVRGDAVYVDRGGPWNDDGKLGRFRLKGYLPGPLPAPRSLADLTRLGREAEGAA